MALPSTADAFRALILESYDALSPRLQQIARYVLDLRSITGGRAELTMEPDHYDILPSHLVPA